MITPIHVLLKADPCLEDDVADDKAEPLVCLHVLRQAGVFFKEVLSTVVVLFWQTGKGGEWQGICCIRRPQEFMILDLYIVVV